MQSSRNRIVLIQVIIGLVLGATTAGAADVEHKIGKDSPIVIGLPVMTLYAVKSPSDRTDLKLLDHKLPQPKRTVSTAPKRKPSVKPVSKPKPAAKKIVTAAKRQPKPTVSKPAPAPKPKPVAAKPAPQKQGLLSRVMQGAAGLTSRAASWVGTRYTWGGLSSRGVDCSGLTSLLYKSLGIALPHSAKQQYKMGQPVAKKELTPGDLVFFNTTGAISHVGMYIGDNKFVHAANRHRGVRTDSLGTPYYSKRYVGARRYI